MVRMSLESRRDELLYQSADRTAISAHAALFYNYVALIVKLPHHRVQKAFRLEICPKLHTVRGKTIVVPSLIIVGEGVHPFTTFTLHDLAKFVGLDILVRLSNSIFQGLL